ncbi:L-lactate permease [Kytococcus aerolatus]|uniref:L-lactate permease n=1 Tax=Kytococcus aerolatus TaxID=592308 RepID=UPI001F300AF5|nr:L-lactate permease [Kytococcus aerolatus]
MVATLPLLTVFVTLAVLRWKAHWSGLAGVGVALLVAWLAFGMPLNLAALSATQGAAFGLFPISWIVFTAIVLYEVTVASGRFLDLRATFHLISGDPRIQAVIVAFCFGGLLEALAGFGAPVAITGVMMVALGYPPLRAAIIVLLANTAPVAFGAIAIPIITAGKLTGIPYEEIGALVGLQAPFVAVFVPLLLVFIADGRRGVRQVWPMALVIGATFALAQWATATFVSVELTDIVASLAGLAAAVLLLRVWRPRGTEEALVSLEQEREKDALARGGVTDSVAEVGAEGAPVTSDVAELEERARSLTSSRITLALLPYLLVIAVFAVAQLVAPVKRWLASTTRSFGWPGLDGKILTVGGDVSEATVYSFAWLSSPGTLLLLVAVVIAFVDGIGLGGLGKVMGETMLKMRFAFLTVASVLALAYVMNFSGQTLTIGTWIAGSGVAFAFLSPVLGWIGTAVTGSDTSANALFATLQQTAAQEIDVDPALLVASNTTGGVVGKMISPQNLTIAALAVGLAGRESEILRKVLPWSIGLLLVVCLIVGLQATVLEGVMP